MTAPTMPNQKPIGVLINPTSGNGQGLKLAAQVWEALEAAGVLQPVGIVLTPAVGAILMSASTIIVAANAQLLRRKN